MESFLRFLKCAKSFLKDFPTDKTNIHITMGNESCDLDSTISSLLLGYFLSTNRPQQVVIPILNVGRNDFILRTENCYVLNQAHVPLEDLTFRDEVDFMQMIKQHKLTVTLVDHHILNKSDIFLQPYVTEIFDHRPIDTNCVWNKEVDIRIEEVGSCATLITDKILTYNESLLTKPLAYLLYQTIVFDNLALKLENRKATVLDIDVAEKLENKFGFNEDRQILFDRLWQAHNDISQLSPLQLLYKDLKVFEQIYIPGLPMLVEDYLKLDGAFEAVTEFSNEQKISCVLLVGISTSNRKVQRDMAIYSATSEDKLKNVLLNVLTKCEANEFELEERKTEFSDNICLFHVNNIQASRKQLIPLVKKAWHDYINDKKCV